MKPSYPDITGLILAGGASRRMGTDKAFLEIDGVPLIVRVHGVLAPFELVATPPPKWRRSSVRM